jgi:hypothetical protein
MLNRLALIAPDVFRMRPHLVTKYLVPTSFAMLSETRGEVKTANTRSVIIFLYLLYITSMYYG